MKTSDQTTHALMNTKMTDDTPCTSDDSTYEDSYCDVRHTPHARDAIDYDNDNDTLR